MYKELHIRITFTFVAPDNNATVAEAIFNLLQIHFELDIQAF